MTKMMALMAASMFLVSCGSSTGSGDGGPSGGCASVQGSCTPSGGQGCVEYGGYPTVDAAQQACTNGGGTFASSGCTRTDLVGGCRRQQGTACTTTWFYTSSGATVAQVQASCSMMGATYVGP